MENSEKIYCPDCGSELAAYINSNLDEPFDAYKVWYCSGTCLDERCQVDGIRLEQMVQGWPKMRQYLGENYNNNRERKERRL